jgi:putative tryptophan/tyrosine transport system substrate-binding protein
VKRRELMSLLGGAAAGWPLAAQAQHPAIPVVGYLNFGSPEASANLTTAFRKGLSEAGFVEGQNVAIEYRWARNDAERLPELATDLVRRRAAVIVTPASAAATLAVKAVTATIPIVFRRHSTDAARHCRRGDRVKRREFITLLGGAAAAWPLAAPNIQKKTLLPRGSRPRL